MADVEFEDFSIQVMGAIDDAAIAFLHEAAGELVNQAVDNSRVDTGQLRSSWSYHVDEADGKATIGSPLENAIWEEFGTGEYAVKGNGRKGGWFYEDKNGETVFTRGKTPNHTLQRAFDSKKGIIKRRAEQIFRERMS